MEIAIDDWKLLLALLTWAFSAGKLWHDVQGLRRGMAKLSAKIETTTQRFQSVCNECRSQFRSELSQLALAEARLEERVNAAANHIERFTRELERRRGQNGPVR